MSEKPSSSGASSANKDKARQAMLKRSKKSDNTMM